MTIVFWLVSFVLCTAQHSIYRYAIPLEMLTTPLLLLCLYRILPRRSLGVPATMLFVAISASAKYPDFGRIPYGSTFFAVDVPALPPGAMIVLIEDAPISYVLPYFRPEARFIGANSNFNQPWRRNLLVDKTRRTISEHQGAMFSLQWSPKAGDEALSQYGLHKIEARCTAVRTNMPFSPLLLCPLQRQ